MESCETSAWEGFLLILSLPVGLLIFFGGLAFFLAYIDRKFPL